MIFRQTSQKIGKLRIDEAHLDDDEWIIFHLRLRSMKPSFPRRFFSFSVKEGTHYLPFCRINRNGKSSSIREVLMIMNGIRFIIFARQ
ncbi:hypothetical protein CEXT_641491 [Caerostris extrusa]|uniref:Uncharacterized protein n=1 Tax=Caerostris extrusa TaxID=172846 RepID=A0AAV4R811_CAEEX|nr:hypothetical protein CEXT_641491 [Caerostris extrusa]